MLRDKDNIRIQFVDLLLVGLQNACLVLDHGVEAGLAYLDEALRLNGMSEDEYIRVFDVRAQGFGRNVALEDQAAHAGCSHAISRSSDGEHPNLLDETKWFRSYKSVHLHLVDRFEG